jgi:hypothetical protein
VSLSDIVFWQAQRAQRGGAYHHSSLDFTRREFGELKFCCCGWLRTATVPNSTELNSFADFKRLETFQMGWGAAEPSDAL